MQLLTCAKNLSEQEQDQLLQRFEEGHTIWYFRRANIDIRDLMRILAGQPSRAEQHPSPYRGDQAFFGKQAFTIIDVLGVEEDNKTYRVRLASQLNGTDNHDVRFLRSLGTRNTWKIKPSI